ncbi:folylpolyglutamate synthase/dihydrofolate synthase family protein [soil metagenome]
MNYQDTVQWLFAQLPMFQRIGAAAYKNDLTNTLKLTALMGEPQRRFKSVHIAGTNGKGTTAHALAAIFTTAGYKTGLYISPHYKDFRERIKIDGQYISEAEVVDFVAKYQSDFEEIQPSFFEMTVAMAFEHFARHEVNIAIIETGMGGRFDSTNVITPELSIITNIGYDHTKFLGETLPLIAFEKAGIIKPGIPTVIGETQPETQPVFDQSAAEHGSTIVYADQHYRVNRTDKAIGSMIVDVLKDGKPYLQNLQTDLYGNYQLKNLATVFGAVEQLQKQGYPINDAVLRKGLFNVQQISTFMGRCQVLHHEPLVLVDSGHNEAGFKEIFGHIKELNYSKVHVVIGTVNDKDLTKMLPLMPKNATYYFCKPDLPRGRDAEELHAEALKYSLQGHAYHSVQ